MTNAETMFFTGYAAFAVAVALAVLLMRWQLEISKTWEPRTRLNGNRPACRSLPGFAEGALPCFSASVN
jgi:hypothetical protein